MTPERSCFATYMVDGASCTVMQVLLLVRRSRSVSTVLSLTKRIRGRCLLIFIFLFGDSEYYK